MEPLGFSISETIMFTFSFTFSVWIFFLCPLGTLCSGIDMVRADSHALLRAAFRSAVLNMFYLRVGRVGEEGRGGEKNI